MTEEELREAVAKAIVRGNYGAPGTMQWHELPSVTRERILSTADDILALVLGTLTRA